MAANKPFANFDKLSKLARPGVLTPSNTPSQGGQKINPGFAQQISLEDRLKQSGLGTTKHLAQYFVTDVFTNIIKIKKPIEIPKDSLVSIGLPSETRQQGGEVPRPILFVPIHGETDPRAVRYNLAEKQGIIKLPDAYEISNITITYPTNQINKSLAQGTYYLNGKYFSITQTETPPITLEQGTVEIKKVVTIREQGGTDPEKPISVGEVEIAQGIVTLNGKARSQTSTMIPVPEVLQGDGITPTAAAEDNAFINGQSINLRTVGYLSLGFGLRFLPVVVQGGQSPRNALSEANNATTQHSEGGLNPTNELEGEGGFRVTHTRSATISALLNPPIGTSTFTQAQLQAGIVAGAGGGSLDSYANIGPNANLAMENPARILISPDDLASKIAHPDMPMPNLASGQLHDVNAMQASSSFSLRALTCIKCCSSKGVFRYNVGSENILIVKLISFNSLVLKRSTNTLNKS